MSSVTGGSWGGPSTHILQPASRPSRTYEHIPRVPTYTLISWTLGRGSVIWRIWPAVMLHTLFSIVIVTISMEKIINLEIPNIMLTVLGVVIGFVISYRAMSGYDRYWVGRTCWSDIMKNARVMGRLIWFHVPPRTSGKIPKESERSPDEMEKVMKEKRMALDLIEGFAVAVKHHIRGETGIYYEDLYNLILPLHDRGHEVLDARFSKPSSALTEQFPTSSSPNVPLGISSGTDNNQNNLSQRNVSHSPQVYNHDHTEKPVQIANGCHWQGPLHPRRMRSTQVHKERLRASEEAGNLPLAVLRCLSEWCSVLEDRGSVPGTSLGSMIATIAAFEDNLTTLERTLTTPLPFVYAVHISTVWIYLVFLPFQLVKQFGYYTIPGVALAAFIYLGFLTAGEEMEQPFGYDDNDLDLDLFCHDIIHADISHLKNSPCLNAYFPPEQTPTLARSVSIVEAACGGLVGKAGQSFI